MRVRVWSENRKERDHLEDLVVDGRVTVKRILNRITERRLDSCGSG